MLLLVHYLLAVAAAAELLQKAFRQIIRAITAYHEMVNSPPENSQF